MKTCRNCGVTKSDSEFYRVKKGSDKTRNVCKQCENEKRKLRERKDANGCKAKRREKSSKRLEGRGQRWGGRNINRVYTLAKRTKQLTGVDYHVGHILPVRGELVNGLHITANLILEPAKYNLSHGNRFVPFRWCDNQYYELDESGTWKPLESPSWHDMVSPEDLISSYSL